jgi:hypothetical protein
VILATIRIDGDDTDWFDGKCELAAVPPIGGHVRVMDRNANVRRLRVVDVVVHGVSIKLRRETPGGLRPYDGSQPAIEVVCSELS